MMSMPDTVHATLRSEKRGNACAGRLLEKHILWARDLAVAHLPLITPDRPAVTAK